MIFSLLSEILQAQDHHLFYQTDTSLSPCAASALLKILSLNGTNSMKFIQTHEADLVIKSASLLFADYITVLAYVQSHNI